MRRRHVIGLVFVIGLLVLAVSRTGSALTPYFECLADANTEGQHGVQLVGETGFFDFAHNPTSLEVDWDDGTWSSKVNTGDEQGIEFHHVYTTGGLRHIKFYADDAIGDTCDEGYPVTYDVNVQ